MKMSPFKRQITYFAIKSGIHFINQLGVRYAISSQMPPKLARRPITSVGF